MPDLTSPSAVAWWRTAAIYQVYIRSFADGDGDGIGDLAGIRSRLPYLHDLGVDALWITPFYPSPMADGGYDVADYRDIDPLFGTLADADVLIAEAHDQALRVIIDLVPNHSSDRHRWFQAALAAPSGSPERARYIFRPGRGPEGSSPPNDWQSTFGGSAWQRVPDGEWYLHLFAPEQPDFNWENPEVVEEFEDVLRFWLDRGVDGFRIDVANSLKKDQAFPDLGDEEQELFQPKEGPDHPFWDRDEVHEVYRGWRRVADRYDGDRMFVAEAWVDSPERLALYTRPDELQTAFNFSFVRTPWDADALRRTVEECIEAASSAGAPATWVLSNHDITRDATRFARLDSTGGGVSAGDRVGPDTPLDPELGLRRARAAALLMLALPGSAYVYQGEELGLPDVVDLPEDELADPIWVRSGHTERGRDGCRVPIPWSEDGPSLGFGSGKPWLPQPPVFAGRSVQAESGVAGSTLELYRQTLLLRRGLAVETGVGWLPSPAGSLAFRRRATDGTGVVCVVACTPAEVPLPAYEEVLVSSAPLTASLDGPARLPGDSAVWLRVH
ncbi:MAG TPA: alpha-amylase family glycosyl hydrolase [Actinomycetes bacterium]|nr:alpha-amylase family glycosyl hydrolase [Actinomycetes bacterium]